MPEPLDTVTWSDGRVRYLDQTRLPQELVYVECDRWEEVAEAIRALRVRGAPAIGIAAGFGAALAARVLAARAADAGELARGLEEALAGLAATRPTAVNLFWALARQREVVRAGTAARLAPREIAGRLLDEAEGMLAEDRAMGERIARHGAPLLPEEGGVLTHCNTGGLATGGVGTALAVIVAAHRGGKKIHVYADETRPLLQGARLTTWELAREGVPVTLVCDSASGSLMARGLVQAVIVGADRIAANGDVANKVGTYVLAALAGRHGVPFYVAAPLSTVDLATASGGEIRIEERDPREVTEGPLGPVAPAGVAALNPAFDLTPADLVSAIVTDAGVVRPPYGPGLAAVAGREGPHGRRKNL